MLFGLAFSNNTANTTTTNDNDPITVTTQNLGMGEDPDTGGSDTGGDTGPVLPPKK
ncbi:hypothetical protein [Chryseobacterium indologenes]|uniref:hypothetical protein n=1 Tax=Chryseobacterium indologenes TaxID=253 RepID=UPI001314F5B6|nr:hypothetical protein [Chryseobacterium indologenes]